MHRAVEVTALVLLAFLRTVHALQGSFPARINGRRLVTLRRGYRYSEGDDMPESIRAPRPVRSDIKSKGGTKAPRRSNQGKALELGMSNPSRLKVMGGKARGRRLDSPQVQLRPMMGKVKEALFSTLTFFGVFDETNGAVRHLDLFSGSGSVGIESLSRGAAEAVFVDLAQECCDVAEKNVAWCELVSPDGASLAGRAVCADVGLVLTEPLRFGLDKPFDLVTVTPPYEEVSYPLLCEQLATSPLVVDDTIVVVEYPIELGTLPPVLGTHLKGIRNRRYGRTALAIYVCNPTGRWDLDARSEEFVELGKHK